MFWKNQTQKQIVILGAGFAGLRAALDIAKGLPHDRVILVDQKPFQVYHPALHEVATSLRWQADVFMLKGTVAVEIDDVVARRKNITFKQAKVELVDVNKRIVRTDTGDLAYDYLVIALGSKTDYYGIPGLEQRALPLKTFEDGVKIRNRIYESFVSFSRTQDVHNLSFIIGGGGFSGVELASEMVNCLRRIAGRERGTVPAYSVWLIEGANQLLPGFPAKLSNFIKRRLEYLGVKVLTGSRITEARDNGVVIDNHVTIPGSTIIWTGGVRACGITFNKNIPLDSKDRIMVSSRLNLETHPEVFIAGDVSCFHDKNTGRPLPQTAQMALHQAKHAARGVISLAYGSNVPIYRPKKKHPFIITLSGKYAAVYENNKIIAGWPAYLVRKFSDLRYLMSVLPWRKALPFWFKGSVILLKND